MHCYNYHFFFISHFIWKIDKSIFHLMGHSTNNRNSWGCARPKLRARNCLPEFAIIGSWILGSCLLSIPDLAVAAIWKVNPLMEDWYFLSLSLWINKVHLFFFFNSKLKSEAELRFKPRHSKMSCGQHKQCLNHYTKCLPHMFWKLKYILSSRVKV